MTINIIALGKLKERYLHDACKEYLKRLSFLKINIIEISPIRLSESPSENEILIALQKEGNEISKHMAKGSYTICLCKEGMQMDSQALANTIEKISCDNFSNVNFIIGSSYGISEAIKQKANMLLSLSKMTFPHQLARVMLLEQVYRAFSIIKGSKYHK